jgi:hypothetical protein
MLSQGGNFFASLDKSRFLITDLQQDCHGQNIKSLRGFSCALFCLVYVIAGLWMLTQLLANIAATLIKKKTKSSSYLRKF